MSGLVVIEGKWYEQNNLSVKSLFDVLIDINFNSPHKYYYETFANNAAFGAIVDNICGPNAQRRYLYIGAHGEHDLIWGSANSVSRTELRNDLRNLDGSIKGVFFGSCFFGNQENAQFLFNAAAGVPGTVRWIAGYQNSIDWIKSSVLDLLFWNTLFQFDDGTRTPNEVIVSTCEKIVQLAPGLARTLGFQVFTRTPGPGDALTKLINV